MRHWDAINPTGQQEALPFFEGHVSEELSKDGVSFDRQGHCSSVLADFICGDADIPASIFRLVERGQQTEKVWLFVVFEGPHIWFE